MFRSRGMQVLAAVSLWAGAALVFAPSSAVAQETADEPASPPSGVVLSTPYSGVVVQPGSVVDLDVEVRAPSTQPVALTVEAPEGWRTVLRGGGFVVTGVTAGPDEPASVQLEVTVPADVSAGTHQIVVTGSGPAGTGSLTTDLTVQAEVDSGIAVAADFPSLRGGPDDTFSYTLTITNNTPEEQSFNFSPRGPSGWEVTASPQAEAQANTVTIEPGGTANVDVTATPAANTPEGDYPINVEVVAANGATGSIELTAQVTGTAQLELATADGQLNASGQAGDTSSETLVVANTGTAPLEAVQLSATPPGDWEVTFEPSTVESVPAGGSAQVTARIRPASDSVAGDYIVSVQATSGSSSSQIDVRYSVETSSLVGWIAGAVIVAAVVVLFAVYRRFGRR